MPHAGAGSLVLQVAPRHRRARASGAASSAATRTRPGLPAFTGSSHGRAWRQCAQPVLSCPCFHVSRLPGGRGAGQRRRRLRGPPRVPPRPSGPPFRCAQRRTPGSAEHVFGPGRRRTVRASPSSCATGSCTAQANQSCRSTRAPPRRCRGSTLAPGQLSVGPARAVLDMHRWTAPPPAHGMHRSGAPRRADPRAARGRRHRRHRRHRRGRSTPVVLCRMAGASKLLPVCGALLPALAGSSRPGPSPALPPPPRPRRLCRRKPRLGVSTMPKQSNIKLCNPHAFARHCTTRRCCHTQATPCQWRQPCA